jgi:hypothetical protein
MTGEGRDRFRECDRIDVALTRERIALCAMPTHALKPHEWGTRHPVNLLYIPV